MKIYDEKHNFPLFIRVLNVNFPCDVDISTLVEKAQTIKATGGKPCNKTTSQGFKMRKNDGSTLRGSSIGLVLDVLSNGY